MITLFSTFNWLLLRCLFFLSFLAILFCRGKKKTLLTFRTSVVLLETRIVFCLILIFSSLHYDRNSFSSSVDVTLILAYPLMFSNHCCSVAKSCPTLCNPMDCSAPATSVLHYLLEFAQIHVHWISDAIQPSHPLLPSFPFAFNLFQHHGLFQWGNSWYFVTKVLELLLQQQSSN